jgi:uncharacterized protein YkwD
MTNDTSDTGSMDNASGVPPMMTNDTSDTGSMDNASGVPPMMTNDTSDTGSMENNATLNPLGSGGPNNMTNARLRVEGNTTGSSTYPVYNASRNNDIYSGGGDLASMILAGHNRVRADVGVAPLVWNDSLAKAALTWAEHLAETGQLYHDPDPNRTYGESISARGGVGPDVPMAHMQEFFFSEMNNYHGQSEGAESAVIGHYTQAVWSRTTSVGCATASSSNIDIRGNIDILVCRYSPPGNVFGQTPY